MHALQGGTKADNISTQQHWDGRWSSKLKAIIKCKFKHLDDTLSLTLSRLKDKKVYFLERIWDDFNASLYITVQRFCFVFFW